jgi:hypothetical protein
VPISNGLRGTGQQTASTDKWVENRTGQQTPGMVDAMLTELRYERWFLPLSVPLGLGPKKSEVRIADGTLHVKMGWGFDAHIPIASITRAEATEERAFTAGVHYSSGRWLVNGSSKGLVTLTIEPPVKAKAAFRTVMLRSLVVSVTDPEALIAACTGATG